MSKVNNNLYRTLPSGNMNDVHWLHAELNRRGVQHRITYLRSGGVQFNIPASEIHKLPTDEKGPYLGNADRGFSLFEGDGDAH